MGEGDPGIPTCINPCMQHNNDWLYVYNTIMLWICLIIGTEFQSWLLWYSLPVLQGILPSAYYHHYSCLVAAVGMLLGTQLTSETIDRANVLLNNFCLKMSNLYGEDHDDYCL